MRERLLLVILLGGCGQSGSPANVAGDYTVAVVNGQNGCAFTNWQMGATSNNIPVTITQSGVNATAVVGGAAGTYMQIVLGSNTFNGEVSVTNVSLQLFGKTQGTSGNCSWTVNAAMDATASGDFLSGTISYTDATNGSPDCGTRMGCTSVQNFNGTRPPQ